MTLNSVGFSEEIGKLHRRRGEGQGDSTMLNMMLSKMTVDLNMFSTLMKDSIVRNLNGTFIITIHRCR